ncbi:MAG: energy transducer TonB [Acidobacteria bacterium]|nr:MAG: energy transducer TonB [Acidobacteriota bacterium]
MSDKQNTQTVSVPVGHLAVRFEDTHPVEVPFLFEQQQKRLGEAMGFSVVAHVAFFLLAILVLRYAPDTTTTVAENQSILPESIVWLNQPGPGGGGGGGGNQMKEPPRKAELPGRDKITVPVTKRPPAMVGPVEKPEDVTPPVQELTIPAKTMGSSTETLPGVLEGTSASSMSQGPGSGGGAGTGTGTGIGPGTGSGLGPGWGGGFGGGAYQPGSGIDTPQVIREVKPQYTAEAMRAKIQGIALLEAVVLPDGTVGDVRVVRSLDPVFGLDQEALKAAKQWRFVPGRRQGQPVPVLVLIELTFTLR